jgi:hypothetical protein
MVLGVLLKRKANRFVLEMLLVAVFFAANSSGAVEADRVETKLGAVAVFEAARLFFCAAGREPVGQKSHAPASNSRPSKIQNVERERINFHRMAPDGFKVTPLLVFLKKSLFISSWRLISPAAAR